MKIVKNYSRTLEKPLSVNLKPLIQNLKKKRKKKEKKKEKGNK